MVQRRHSTRAVQKARTQRAEERKFSDERVARKEKKLNDRLESQISLTVVVGKMISENAWLPRLVKQVHYFENFCSDELPSQKKNIMIEFIHHKSRHSFAHSLYLQEVYYLLGCLALAIKIIPWTNQFRCISA